MVNLGEAAKFVRGAAKDIASIVQFGLRPHPGTFNTPFLKDSNQAELFGAKHYDPLYL